MYVMYVCMYVRNLSLTFSELLFIGVKLDKTIRIFV